MSLYTDLAAVVAAAQTNKDLLEAIVTGPASGGASLVTLPGPLQVKTLARISAEASNFFAGMGYASPAIVAGTLSLDLAAADTFNVTFNGAVTVLALVNPPVNRTVVFNLCFIGDGSDHDFNWPAGWKPTDNKSGTPPKPSTILGDESWFSVFYSGTTYWVVSCA